MLEESFYSISLDPTGNDRGDPVNRSSVQEAIRKTAALIGLPLGDEGG